MRTVIEKRIAEFLATDDPTLAWVKPAVRKHTFLPLYVGWVAVLGIQPDGVFVRWDHEDDRETVRPLTDAYWQRMAISQGTKRYPDLGPLLPQRPASALTCDVCDGTGQLRGAPQIICECGGIGWILPDEEIGPSPG